MSFWSPLLVGIGTGSVVTWAVSRFRQRRRVNPISNQWGVPSRSQDAAAATSQEQAEHSGDTQEAVNDAEKEPDAVSPTQVARSPAFVAAAQNELETIRGIGSRYAGLLKAAGITTCAALAALTPEEVKEILTQGDVPEQLIDPQDWIEQARQLAGNGGQQG